MQVFLKTLLGETFLRDSHLLFFIFTLYSYLIRGEQANDLRVWNILK